MRTVEREGDTGATLAFGCTLLAAAVAAFLTWTRVEWRVRPGRLTLRRTFAGWAWDRVFESPALEMADQKDSEGEHRYTLRVRAAHPPTRPHPIASALRDPYELSCLGEWLAARAQTTLDAQRVGDPGPSSKGA